MLIARGGGGAVVGRGSVLQRHRLEECISAIEVEAEVAAKLLIAMVACWSERIDQPTTS